MSYGNNNSAAAGDPFSAFWTDLMSRMSGMGTGQQGPSAQDEMLRQMRQAFFDSWGMYCEDFMRSPAFLETMKKTMDNALVFRQQMNEFLTRSLHGAQAPARSDTDSILLVLRSLEDRVLSRVEELGRRVDDLAGRVGRIPDGPPPAPASAPRTKGGSR